MWPEGTDIQISLPPTAGEHRAAQALQWCCREQSGESLERPFLLSHHPKPRTIGIAMLNLTPSYREDKLIEHSCWKDSI